MISVPQDWQQLELSVVAEVQTGIAKGAKTLSDPVELPYLRVANVQDGYLDLSEIKTILIDRHQINRYLLRIGDVLLTEGGDFDKLGRGTVWNGQIENCVHQNHVFVVRTNPAILLPHFFSALTSSSYGKQYFLSCAKQTTNLASINSSQLKAFPVLIPPLAEQHKIVDFLSAFDEAIDLTEQLIAAKQRRKQALMQYLLLVSREEASPHHRFPAFTGPWQQRQFGEVFERVTRKNTIGNDNVLTISAQHGLISQTQFFNKIVASDSLSGYYLLMRGEFAYNKSYSEGYPYGAFKRLNDYDAGVLSTLYVCFCIKAPNVNSDYFVHFFEAGGMNHGIYSIAQEGARNHGLLNMSIADLFNLPIFIPSLEEQYVLASFFNDLDYEIDLIQQKLTALRQQKQGLMQQLLTGKVRVKV